MSLGSRVRVGGWICAVSLPERWYGCRLWVSVRISLILCSRIDYGSNPSKQKKKEGKNLPLKNLVCGPVCWAKMVQF